jgi:putative redox protein
MDKITATIEKELYKVEIKSPTNNILIADEPVDIGGKDQGLNPNELLISALAACTNITVRMYADRKQWPLDEVKTEVDIESIDSKTTINRKIEFIGSLTDEQRKRLLAVANACPVHKILTNPIAINTETKTYE